MNGAGVRCTNKELYRYSLREGQPVSDGVYGEIMGEVLTKRAKRRVLYLLRSMDRTEQQLRQKLEGRRLPGRDHRYRHCLCAEAALSG